MKQPNSPQTQPQRRGPCRRSRRRRYPPTGVWGLLLTSAVVISCVRTGNLTADHAKDNIVTLVFGFLGAMGLVCWFVFCSSYPRVLRSLTGVAVITGPLLLMSLFEIHHVSGELVPVFRARWHRPIDAALPTVASRRATSIDLISASEFDFPQFLGPRRTALVERIQLERDWTLHPPRLVWQQPMGAGWSAFSAVNGYAVTMEQRGDEELVTCYEITTGEPVWSHSTASRHATTLGGTGPRSTPTIDGGRIYTLGATGTVLCLNGATGDVLWRDNVLQRFRVDPEEDLRGVAWGRSASLLVAGELLIVPAGGPAEGPHVSLIAFDKHSGEVVWQAGERQVSYSSPVFGSFAGVPQVVIVNQDFVSGHYVETGELLWEHSWPGNSATNANVSQPLLLPQDQVLLSKGYGGGAGLYQLEAAKGKLPYRLREIWHNRRLLKTKFTNLVLRDGFLYGLSDGILECVRLPDGQRQWKRGRYGHGQVLGVSDMLLVQAEAGYVALVEANPTRFRELGRFDALTGKTWANPCLSGTYLLVRNSEQAACYELSGHRPQD